MRKTSGVCFMNIKIATEGDLPQLGEFFLELIRHFSPLTKMNIERAKQYAKRHLDRSGDFVFIAFENNNLIGAVVVRILSKIRALLRDAYVSPAHRKKGVMKAIEKDVKEFLIKKGIKTIELTVTSRNEEGMNTWNALGYIPHVIRMLKKIA
jgi:GNAT superfamily N-acetyltransferase